MAASENSGFCYALIRLVAGTLVVLGLCYGCCAPKGFFGNVRVLRATVAPGMPQTDVELVLTGYDAENKRVAVAYPVGYSTPHVTKRILDFGKGLQFVLMDAYLDNATCTQYPLNATWREACMPANATKSANFKMGYQEGQYSRPLDAVAFTYTQGSVKAKVMVTNTNNSACALVGEVVCDISDPGGAKVINRLYVNQSMSADDDFFKPPANIICKIGSSKRMISQEIFKHMNSMEVYQPNLGGGVQLFVIPP